MVLQSLTCKPAGLAPSTSYFQLRVVMVAEPELRTGAEAGGANAPDDIITPRFCNTTPRCVSDHVPDAASAGRLSVVSNNSVARRMLFTADGGGHADLAAVAHFQIGHHDDIGQ